MVNFLETEQEISISDIHQIETEVGITFPEKYTKHLLDYNGGRCEPNIVLFLEGNKSTSSDIAWFLAVGSRYENIKQTFLDLKPRIPKGYLPIARDSLGNYYCMSCLQENKESIYFWDHEAEGEDPEVMANMYFVAKNITEFLDSITDSCPE